MHGGGQGFESPRLHSLRDTFLNEELSQFDAEADSTDRLIEKSEGIFTIELEQPG